MQKLLAIQENMLSLVGDTAAVRILFQLAGGTTRFSEFTLEVSSKTLSSRLKLLEQNNLITRTAYPEIPPRVEYSLTAKGREFLTILEGIVQWEESWLQPEL